MTHSRAFWRLNGCWIIFRGNFRTQYWYLYLNMPLESLQTYFSNNPYAIWNKNTHLFLAFEELDIDTELSLWFWIFNIWNSVLKYPSESSFECHRSDLILILQGKVMPNLPQWPNYGLFSKDNLYDMPRVTVSSFDSEIDIPKTTVHVLVANFYRITIWCSEIELWRFSHG